LVCADGVDLLGENMNNLSIKGNTKTQLVANKVVRAEKNE
jgi:hypothetical protein